ncbi:tRNA uridine(34) 5-carboxymethylaminomethyl modification radical SAM/GNAT enzyme Elp3 [Candidatus Fermentibacteria bacterium]|nr:tRNA uridine(34) 5-carboxymethylaminomethyl modification radical SAM/GNAT enzyme Elp3 [Candidatus Fermentibacteria bacterium]
MTHHENLRERWAEWTARHEDGGSALSDATLVTLMDRLTAVDTPTHQKVRTLIHRIAGPTVSKVDVLRAYRALVARGLAEERPELLSALCLKPTRTISGVTPVAVMTEPHPCPGSCIFCPDFDDMPKSYITDEPGALRGLQLDFDPYRQTRHRIQALTTIGHATDKIELIVLGGTWSAYPREYQERFIRRCFDGMNESDSTTLGDAQQRNERAQHRNVGLAVETRPDLVTLDEAAWLRRLGVTKVQVGVQSLDDRILSLNRRGHTADDTRRAFAVLRAAGFKIHAHWMPNLLGATPESDLVDFARLWDDPAIRPDELKIYPCSLIAGTELYRLWEGGEYVPYSDDELIELLARCKAIIPPYCRVTRLMRDIPVHHIEAGCRIPNLRQTVRRNMGERGLRCRCIRCREVRVSDVDPQSIVLDDTIYETPTSTEHFLSFVAASTSAEPSRLAGFLRLSLPTQAADVRGIVLPELRGAALIREVHVYGPSLPLGTRAPHAQHRGLGTRLLEEAAHIARNAGFRRLSVISAIGTRAYYRARGFRLGELYVHQDLDSRRCEPSH